MATLSQVANTSLLRGGAGPRQWRGCTHGQRVGCKQTPGRWEEGSRSREDLEKKNDKYLAPSLADTSQASTLKCPFADLPKIDSGGSD